MKVRIATCNIFWFPSSGYIGNSRSSTDLDKVREVIARLDADIIVFQEIRDLQALNDLLSAIPNRSYKMRDKNNNWAASTLHQPGNIKVPVAFDSNKLELLEVGNALVAGEDLSEFGMRDPVAARLRPVGGGPTLTVIGVHLKSGDLTVEPMVSADDKKRIEEIKKLLEWIKTLAPVTPGGQKRPAQEPTVLLGDFNAINGNVSLKHLLSDAVLSTWAWPQPRFASSVSPSPVELLNLQTHERWTTHLDKKIIDHVFLSPEVKLVEGPWVYAYDRDDSWLQAAGVSKNWLEEFGYTLTKNGISSPTKNINRVTDHRPVRVTVELT